ncbi:MFS transporter [Streptomyces sp. NPDC048637]|uniref:MFS transporter n=1 Tax=Streptomyces sp. NPDC048637 TaxID=3155636 RepID=UPI00341B78C9
MSQKAQVEGAHRRRWAALITLLIAEAMNLLDATIVTVAAPVIHSDLGGAAFEIQWFNAAYTLSFAVFLITGGRLGDLAGRRRVFTVGVICFAAASLACALAPTAGTLIGVRAVQGATAALIIPQTIGLIRTMFDGAELSRAMGSIGPVMGLAAILGPVLGALLTHADLFGSSWRAIFLVNIPLAVAVLATVPLLPRQDVRSATRPPRLDGVGTVLAILATSLVIHPLIQSSTAGWPVRSWAALVVGCGLLGLFGLHQRHRSRTGRSPLVEVSLFHDRGFPAALATSTLFFTVMNGLMLVVVLQVQLGLGRGVLAAGLTLLPWSAAMAVSSWLAGTRLVPRYGPKVMFAGLAVMLAGLAGAIGAYGTAQPDAYPWPLLGALAVTGLGNGLFTVPFFTTALARVQPQETGSAAGLLNAVQQLGASLGTAILGAAFLHSLHAGVRPAADSLEAARLAFWLAVGLLLGTTATAAAMLGRHLSREPAATDPPHADDQAPTAPATSGQ